MFEAMAFQEVPAYVPAERAQLLVKWEELVQVLAEERPAEPV